MDFARKSYYLALAPNSGYSLAGQCRRIRMKPVTLSEVRDDLSRYLKIAEKEDIVITRHGKPAGVLVGFASEDDWFGGSPTPRRILTGCGPLRTIDNQFPLWEPGRSECN